MGKAVKAFKHNIHVSEVHMKMRLSRVSQKIGSKLKNYAPTKPHQARIFPFDPDRGIPKGKKASREPPGEWRWVLNKAKGSGGGVANGRRRSGFLVGKLKDDKNEKFRPRDLSLR